MTDAPIWYVCQLKPNGLELARKNLSRQGFEIFCPMHAETRRDRQRFVTRSTPLFPGYLFVGLPPGRVAWRALNNTRGIAHLVSFGGRPARVPSGLIEALQERQIGDEGSDLRAGDQVQVFQGPFADLVGQVESIDAEQRIWVVLDVLGQPTRTRMSSGQLRHKEG